MKAHTINTELERPPITEDTTKPPSKVIRIDEGEIRSRPDEMIQGTVEEALNELLDAEADATCLVQRYEQSADRVDTHCL